MDSKGNGRYCVVYGCMNMNKKCPDLSFFSLPKDEKRRNEWLKLIGREDLLNKQIRCKSYEVCEAHFDDSMIKVIRLLKPNAEPVQNLHTPNESTSNPNNDPVGESSQNEETEVKIEVPEEVSDSDSSFNDNFDSDSDPMETPIKTPVARVEMPPMRRSSSDENRKRKMVMALEASKRLMNWKGLEIPSISTIDKDDSTSSRNSKVPKK